MLLGFFGKEGEGKRLSPYFGSLAALHGLGSESQVVLCPGLCIVAEDLSHWGEFNNSA